MAPTGPRPVFGNLFYRQHFDLSSYFAIINITSRFDEKFLLTPGEDDVVGKMYRRLPVLSRENCRGGTALAGKASTL